MFRLVALFALVTVSVAEPQWYGYSQAMDATHMKTASGDTVSVTAKKAEHHQLKLSEYANKGYAYGYVKPTVVAGTPVATYASPVVNYANTYAAGMPLIHHLGKRETEANSQYIYNSGVHTNGYALPNVYNTVASPVFYNGVHNGAYNGVYNGLYNTYTGLHSIGKREAEADSQFLYNSGVYANGYNGYSLPTIFKGAYNTVASPVVSYNGAYNGLYNTYAGVHAIGKREAEADSQWVYNNGYTPLNGYTGYTGLTGYTTPYTYGNVWNRAQYLW